MNPLCKTTGASEKFSPRSGPLGFSGDSDSGPLFFHLCGVGGLTVDGRDVTMGRRTCRNFARPNGLPTFL